MTGPSSPASRRLRRAVTVATVAVLVSFTSACSTSPTRPADASEVLVLGMIHDGHVESDVYGVDVVRDIVRRFDPDYILCEIPPDRLDAALEQYRAAGTITEPRVTRFPEYVDAIIPLVDELDFELIPCAAWTREMADDRRAKLTEWRTTRPEESQEVADAQQWCEDELARLGLDEDPAGIHTWRYDAIVKRGMEPYDRLFNDDLGAGGWENINAAHWALIARALDEHGGEGKRFLVTFGAWHKYWFVEQLQRRDDVVLLELEHELEES